MTNAEKYADKIAKIVAYSLDYVCVLFAKGYDYYGEFDCNTCPLNGVCNSAEKLEKFLKQEAKENDETAAP